MLLKHPYFPSATRKSPQKPYQYFHDGFHGNKKKSDSQGNASDFKQPKRCWWAAKLQARARRPSLPTAVRATGRQRARRPALRHKASGRRQGADDAPCGRQRVFNAWCGNKLRHRTHKNQTGPFPGTIMRLRGLRVLHVRPESAPLPRENRAVISLTLVLAMAFFVKKLEYL